MTCIRKLSLLLLLLLTIEPWAAGQTPYRVLIIDGQNDHRNWQQTSPQMKKYLEETGLFTVDIATNPPSEGGALDSFVPDFTQYQVVLTNYFGAAWPAAIRKRFRDFVSNGGGLMVIHAADQAFPDWPEYTEMIGIGGGSGRNQAGPAIYFDESKESLVFDNATGEAGVHGSEFAFKIKIRNRNHPITRGLPPIWQHEKDGIYNRLKGPANNMQVLATALSTSSQKGFGRHEPVVMVVNYGKGRVFHTTLGHSQAAQQGVGFITLLQRGAEWVASGAVTQPVPADFPQESTGKRRP